MSARLVPRLAGSTRQRMDAAIGAQRMPVSPQRLDGCSRGASHVGEARLIGGMSTRMLLPVYRERRMPVTFHMLCAQHVAQ